MTPLVGNDPKKKIFSEAKLNVYDSLKKKNRKYKLTITAYSVRCLQVGGVYPSCHSVRSGYTLDWSPVHQSIIVSLGCGREYPETGKPRRERSQLTSGCDYFELLIIQNYFGRANEKRYRSRNEFPKIHVTLYNTIIMLNYFLFCTVQIIKTLCRLVTFTCI